jgi:hypothetical protein
MHGVKNMVKSLKINELHDIIMDEKRYQMFIEENEGGQNMKCPVCKGTGKFTGFPCKCCKMGKTSIFKWLWFKILVVGELFRIVAADVMKKKKKKKKEKKKDD